MSRKFMIIGLGAALMLAATILIANRNATGENRASSSLHVATQEDGRLVFTPTSSHCSVTFTYSDKSKLTNTTAQP